MSECPHLAYSRKSRHVLNSNFSNFSIAAGQFAVELGALKLSATTQTACAPVGGMSRLCSKTDTSARDFMQDRLAATFLQPKRRAPGVSTSLNMPVHKFPHHERAAALAHNFDLYWGTLWIFQFVQKSCTCRLWRCSCWEAQPYTCCWRCSAETSAIHVRSTATNKLVSLNYRVASCGSAQQRRKFGYSPRFCLGGEEGGAQHCSSTGGAKARNCVHKATHRLEWGILFLLPLPPWV